MPWPCVPRSTLGPSAAGRVQDDALAQAAGHDLQRRPRRCRRRPASSSEAGRAGAARARGAARCARRRGRRAREHSAASARSSPAASSSPPASRASDVALPPTASASAGLTGGRAAPKTSATAARRASSSSGAGGSERTWRSASRPEPTGSEQLHDGPAAAGPDHQLRRPAADVDHARPARRAARPAPRWRRRRSAAPPPPRPGCAPRRRPPRAPPPRARRGWPPARIAAVPTTCTAWAPCRRARAAWRATTGPAGRSSRRRTGAPAAPARQPHEGALGVHRRHPAGLGAGDEQARRVRADVDAGAAHRLGIMPRVSSAAPAILVRDLHKAYGDHQAVRGLDFEVDHGEVFGLLGPNGAGQDDDGRDPRGLPVAHERHRLRPRPRPRAALAGAARAGRDRPAELRDVPPHQGPRGGRPLGRLLPLARATSTR